MNTPDKKPILLIVDDVPGNIWVLMESLGDSYEFATATNGPDALESIKNNPPDLILLDIMLPGMDGYEILKNIKADPTVRDIPVIFVTSLGLDSDKAKGLEMGAVDYITKPIKPSLIRACVQNHLTHPPTMQCLNGIRVLLVEDSRINQLIAKEMLGNVGIIIEVAQNGQEAVNMATKESYDIILMDIQMPVMNGFTACRLIRNQPKNAKTPIIAMTAHTTAEDREKSLAANMNDHIVKPILMSQLYEILAKWIVFNQETNICNK
ncbi:MAG: response regulator [Magnetococcales bacterium]|nr:response regulator [Magnetococcales bacterium]